MFKPTLFIPLKGQQIYYVESIYCMLFAPFMTSVVWSFAMAANVYKVGVSRQDEESDEESEKGEWNSL